LTLELQVSFPSSGTMPNASLSLVEGPQSSEAVENIELTKYFPDASQIRGLAIRRALERSLEGGTFAKIFSYLVRLVWSMSAAIAEIPRLLFQAQNPVGLSFADRYHS